MEGGTRRPGGSCPTAVSRACRSPGPAVQPHTLYFARSVLLQATSLVRPLAHRMAKETSAIEVMLPPECE